MVAADTMPVTVPTRARARALLAGKIMNFFSSHVSVNTN